MHYIFSSHAAPPLTPQHLRSMSIISDDFNGKPRAGTVADLLMKGGGGEGGGGGGGVEETDSGDVRKTVGSVSSQNSPRVRSFTLIAPVRSKPE